jgi:cell division protein FtsB
MKYLNSIYGCLILLGCVVAIVIFSCLGERGLMNVLSMRKELQKIEQNNKSLEQENESLKEYSYLLKNDTHYIEKIAREELGLLKAGEVVYFFEND